MGVVIGELMFGCKIGGKVVFIGVVLVIIFDLDVVLYLFYDKLDMFSIYRGFSYLLVFSLLGGVFLVFMFSRFKCLVSISFKCLFFFSWFCFFIYLLLDIFIVYGM